MEWYQRAGVTISPSWGSPGIIQERRRLPGLAAVTRWLYLPSTRCLLECSDTAWELRVFRRERGTRKSQITMTAASAALYASVTQPPALPQVSDRPLRSPKPLQACQAGAEPELAL